MTEGLWAAIIGVGGTLLGAVVGFLLGKIDCGKLTVRVKSKSKQPCYNHEKLFEYAEVLTLSLYNSANRNMVFRNASVIFVNEKNDTVLVEPLGDLKTLLVRSYGNITEYMGVYNILPKSGIDIEARFVLDEEKLQLAYKAKMLYLQYENEKFKTITIGLWSCNFQKLAVYKDDEEQNNG